MRRPADTETGLLLPRTFAALAAFFMVMWVAMVSLLPLDMDLAGALHAVSTASAAHMQHAVEASLGQWVWHAVFLPLMVRPVWMMPLCLGLICTGGALSFNKPATGRTTQRRS